MSTCQGYDYAAMDQFEKGTCFCLNSADLYHSQRSFRCDTMCRDMSSGYRATSGKYHYGYQCGWSISESSAEVHASVYRARTGERLESLRNGRDPSQDTHCVGGGLLLARTVRLSCLQPGVSWRGYIFPLINAVLRLKQKASMVKQEPQKLLTKPHQGFQPSLNFSERKRSNSL